MALLWSVHALLAEADVPRHRVIVVHVDHGLRTQSALDAAFVARAAAACGFAFDVRTMDPAHDVLSGESLETAARRWRYEFFREVAREVWAPSGADETKPLLLLAHHADDQTESRLMHLFRGSGPAGLAGMKECEDRADYILLRPFLTLKKETLRATLPEGGWREDATNGEATATRNVLRLEILPRLREIYPGLDEALERFSRLMAADDAYLEERTTALYAKRNIDGALLADGTQMGEVTPLERNAMVLKSVAFQRDAMEDLPRAIRSRLVRHWFSAVGGAPLSFEETEHLMRCFSLATGKTFEHYGIMGLVDSAGVHLLSAERMAERFGEPMATIVFSADEALSGAIETDLGWLSFEQKECVTADDLQGLAQDSSRAPVAFIRAKDDRTFVLRTGEGHERFERFGGGAKRLRKLWNEWHIPVPLRPYWPMLCDASGEILWVVDCARSAVDAARAGEAMMVATWRWK